MYGQDGDVVIHEARHELRHQTKIPELVESVNEQEVSLKKVLKKKQSSLDERKIGLFAEGIDMESFH